MQPIEQRAMTPEIIQKIDDAGVIAVLVIDDVKHAVPTAKALLTGGVDTIELTLRTPAAIECIQAIQNEVPEITMGIGTVLTTKQVEAVAKLGVDFAVAPGCNATVLKAAQENGLSFAPGAMTPSEIEKALEFGCRVIKYCPAEPAGGLSFLKNMAGPYGYLGLKFIPLGGLNLNNARAYLESPLITAIGGSWIANRPLIQNEQWETITRNAQDITDLIAEIRK
jgi:2-dehydro-3-deoxyphosphogluconate aldolase/(4S)-4-hydroxy-2-oxoglutarate aldolase